MGYYLLRTILLLTILLLETIRFFLLLYKTSVKTKRHFTMLIK